MTLRVQIQEEMKNAMRAGDKPRLGVIRLILAAVKQIEVDERIELDDDRMLVVLDKMLKQRRESIKQFDDAGRDDLSEKETFEAGIIQGYLPAQLSEDEVGGLIDAAIEQTGAASMKDMGKVMGVLKPQLQGRADMSAVSQQIRARLNA